MATVQSAAEIEVQPPAMMLGDALAGEWDSSFDTDQSLEHMERTDLQRVADEFNSQYQAISDTNQRILFKQFFALQHKVNADLLESRFLAIQQKRASLIIHR